LYIGYENHLFIPKCYLWQFHAEDVLIIPFYNGHPHSAGKRYVVDKVRYVVNKVRYVVNKVP